MENIAVKTLMMLSEELSNQNTWKNQPPKNQFSHKYKRMHRRSWRNTTIDSLKSKVSKNPQNNDQFRSRKNDVASTGKQKDQNRNPFSLSNDYYTLNKKGPKKHEFSSLVRKKYYLESVKTNGSRSELKLSPWRGQSNRLQTQILHTINFPPNSSCCQMPTYYNKEVFRSILDEKGSYLKQIKSKINPKFSKSTLIIYSRNKAKSSNHEIKSSPFRVKQNRQIIKKSYKGSTLSLYQTAQPATKNKKDMLYKVYSLSII